MICSKSFGIRHFSISSSILRSSTFKPSKSQKAKNNNFTVRSKPTNFVQNDNQKLRIADINNLLKSDVYSKLNAEVKKSIATSSLPIGDRIVAFLNDLQYHTLKIQHDTIKVMENACPGWNQQEKSTALPTILGAYKSQVLKQTTFDQQNNFVHNFADITAYNKFVTKTKHLPASNVIEKAYFQLFKEKATANYLFNTLTIDYLIKGFFSFYSQMIALSDPLVIQSRWKHVDLSHPEKLFPMARRIQRKVFLHIGPTNSGKTYTALKAFQNAKSGFYAGPLRLLAREVYSRMKAANKACNLVTGEEVIEEKDENGEPAKLNSGTIEMTDIANDIDVAVIDEIQMIEDTERGWAWTQAFLGVRAKEIHLCGDPNTENIVRRLAKLAGDEIEVKHYDRLSPLKVASDHLTDPLNNLQDGDCLVFFSKKELVRARDEIQKTTKEKCAIIYGSLPAETRTQQALAFNDPNSEYRYLVATDAVGMGLNLAIRRIIFSRTQKFNGKFVTPIPIAQIKQIGGRAGRYHVPGHGKIKDEPAAGIVTATAKRDLRYIEKCMKTNSPQVYKAGLFPPENFLRDYANSVGLRIQFHHMLQMLERGTQIGSNFFLTNLSDMAGTAELFSEINGLLLEEKIVLSKAPVPNRDEATKDAFRAFCGIIARGEARALSDITEANTAFLAHSHGAGGISSPTDTLEALHRTISLYLWLSYRFPNNFIDREGAQELKLLCEERINMELSRSTANIFGRKRVELA